MLIQITNTCRMGCPHCFDDATPEPNHMSMETFAKALDFSEMIGVRAIVISGGEPTENPEWSEMISGAADRFQSVSVPTNGAWLFSPSKRHQMTEILRQKKNVKLQVSSFPGLYKDHEKTVAEVKEYAQELKALGLKKRMYLETDRKTIDCKMIALGRCATNPELSEIAKNSSCTTSCLTASVMSAQLRLDGAVEILEERGHFCKPMVGFDGCIRFSESCLCPAFANVEESIDVIFEKARSWRPCGGCTGYGKLLRSSEEKHVMARIVLGIKAD